MLWLDAFERSLKQKTPRLCKKVKTLSGERL